MHVLVDDHSMDNLFGSSSHHATKKWCWLFWASFVPSVTWKFVNLMKIPNLV